jgi:nucleoside-diphosphate-sugar epimerase
LLATRAELDLCDQRAVERWLKRQRPDVVIIAAGHVGGIVANASHPADFIYENLMIETNLIHGAWQAGVKRLLNFGSSCMYPRACPQPMTTDLLMTGRLEPTSEPYAIAKWAGVSLSASYHRQHGTQYISTIPCTVYGPADSFDTDASHVLSALIRRFHEALEQGRPEVTLWGSGSARREFLYADDLAEACEVVLEAYHGSEPINIGSGQSRTIHELAELVTEVVGFRGRIQWDPTRPDGAPEKVLDSSYMRQLGWLPRTDLRTGINQTYRWFLEHDGASVGKTSCAS